MTKKIKLFSLLVFLALIFSLTTIYATDIDSYNETASIIEDDGFEEINHDLNQNRLEYSKGTYKELNDEINNKTEIDLHKNYTFDKDIDAGLERGIEINKNVTINGHGFTINSTHLAKLFDVTNTGNLTLNNIILISDYGNYTLFDSARNDATLRNNGIINFNKITFTTFKEAGGSGKESIGASIYNNGHMSIVNSEFINSKIYSDTQTSYGLIENAKELIIKNTTFDNNYIEISTTYATTYVNGLIYNIGKLTLNNVNSTNNKIKTKNSAQGLIRAGPNSEIIIQQSLFENNTIMSESNSAHGTAIHAEDGTMEISNSKFIKNSGAFGSGAIRDGASSIFINNTFEKNSATDNSGAIYCLKSPSTFINNTFIENIAGKDGGALYLTVDTQINNEYLFTNNSFIGNKAGQDGGALYLSGSLGTITSPSENNIFIDNDAGRNGGAILYSPNYSSKYYINNSIFKGNIANNYAVISNYHDSSSELTIQNSIFEDNKVRSKNGKLLQYRVANFDYNYWGSNTPEFSKIGITPSNMVIITIEGNETLTDNANYIIKFKDNVSGQIIKLPNYTVNITSNKNSITPNSIVISEGVGSFRLNIENEGADNIKIVIGNEEIANMTVNVNAIIPKFKITANDISVGDQLDLTFEVKKGPETSNYTWTIYDAENNVIEFGKITEDNIIKYTKQYSVGNYTIKVKLENVEGWLNKEVNDTFQVKNATANTKNNSNNNVNSNNPTIQKTTKTQTKKSTSKITTKKKKSKINAKKKTFKSSKKVKKYTISLKSGNKPIKKVKLTLKIKGKTYKAKTNSRGKATFKIKKLTKKGKYKGIIKFRGNANYKATTKKVRITIK